MAIALTAIHLSQDGFVWQIWAVAAVFYALTAGSITAGYHRLFSHRSYDAHWTVRWALAGFGAAAFQNSIWVWARDHRVHHKYVDGDRDPYSINKGFFHAHMGWMLSKEVSEVVDRAPLSRDLERDAVVQFQHRHYLLIAIMIGLVLPTVIGAAMGSILGGLAVAGLLRIVAVHHFTFFINSLCHFWGSRPYSNKQTARDNWILAFFTFGEGYHNFHHVFAADYRNGIRWYHWDPTKWFIKVCAFLGLARNLKVTPLSSVLLARMEVEEKRLQSSLGESAFLNLSTSGAWEQLSALRERVRAASLAFESHRQELARARRLRVESRQNATAELEVQIELARIEWKAAFDQWRLLAKGISNKGVTTGLSLPDLSNQADAGLKL
jgi:stearoyl-CoA desaturase (delta-9 desaturase)